MILAVMLVKRLLLIPAILLAAWMLAAGWYVSRASVSDRSPQLTMASIGEPDDLNPIISTSTSASDVESLVFNGLLKYDENINIVGDLAQSYQLTQDAIAFFRSPEQAAAAAEKLQAAKDRWTKMKVTAVHQDGPRLKLHFEDPTGPAAGTEYEKELFTILDRTALVETSAITLTFDSSVEGPDKKPLGLEGVRRKLDEFAAGQKDATVHEVVPIGDSMLGLAVFGDVNAFKERLAKEFTVGKAEILDSLDQPLLNEPVITFRLRPNVRWQDGEPLTADDAVFTYQATVDPRYRSPRSSDFWPVKSVTAPDPQTVVVRYRYPFSPCVTSWMASLLPKHILEGKSSQWWADNFNSKPIGTGPFRLDQWRRNEYVRLVANNDYFEGPPNVPAVMYRILPDPFVKQAAFDTGEFDFDSLEPYQVTQYERNKRFEVFRRWGLGYDYIGWNLNNPLFQDKNVRRALAHAIDVDRIVKYVYRGYAKPSNGIFPFQLWFADKDIQPFKHDPALAKKLLAEAGWKDVDGDGILEKDGRKFEFNLITNNGNTLRSAMQMLVQDDLKKVGISVKVATYEWAVFIKNYVDSRQFDAVILGWTLGYSYDMYQLWDSSQTTGEALNFVSYRNPEADKLLEQIRTTFDRDEIIRLCHRLQKVIYDDQPYMFLTSPEGIATIYANKYVVRRPDGKGGWIVEPIRDTEAGFTIYESWWAPRNAAPALAP